MTNIQDKIFGMSSAAREVVKCLFFHGPTWDGNIPSKEGRLELCDLGYAKRAKGYTWLSEEGMKFALESLDLGNAKDSWEQQRSSARAFLAETFSDLARAADTAELLLRKDYPGEAASLHAKVGKAKVLLGN
jgi:hypothetical protein